MPNDSRRVATARAASTTALSVAANQALREYVSTSTVASAVASAA